MNLEGFELNKPILGDCLLVLKKLKSQSIDLTLTDPPYGIKADKGVGGFGASKTDKHYNDSWDSFTPTKEYFDEILRVSKNVLIFGGNFFTNLLPVGTHWIVWDKKGDVKFQNPYSDCELIWTNIKKNTIKKFSFKQQGFITDSKDIRVHPTQKPSELLMQILDVYSKENDIVLDPFAGSFTTAIACENLKRNWICIEKEQKYYDIGVKRINENRLQTRF